ncbi:M23 family metallopeptidase [Spirochaeta isovalerica]|uniref:Murein DD-endopeptidase MepM/ murein hydrolase activator NlpD n=1 Tax=Spirochaeta isovalerica TaxID=150 RepID=A0A841R5S6_9SPIO|nr:M23 family metallopeptidase [Spirochaeta isovalerica]MBB6478731.1 murein DD-endopeptidase MepM/ murein hydrolase activator NlpD [Spirochaeta isovalerica]
MKYVRISIAAVSVILIGAVSIFSKGDESEKELLVNASVEKMEQIDIVEVPYITAVSESLSTVKAEIESGSNLNDFLLDHGLSRDEASSVVYEISPYVDLHYIRAGEQFKLNYIDTTFQGLSMINSPGTVVEVVRDITAENGFRAYEKERTLNTFVQQITGRIDDSLYSAALEAGMNTNILYELIRLLSYDVDFQRDIQEGDTFNVAYEAVYDEEGALVSEGRILSAQLMTDGRDISFFYYEDLEGEGDYYNKEGQTIRKTLLKTPINGAVITSGYGRRISPITGFSKMHQGIDFGAPPGTPIYASGDGVIETATYNAVYGNFIEIRHVNGYRTLYGHMTRYARGMRKGIRVKQGAVIGYVGSTGMSTGPHLHYEVSYWGTKINPSNVKSPPGRTLAGKDKLLFENIKNSYIASFR